MEPTKIQVLDVRYPEGIEKLEVIEGQVENIREIATKHGVRSLLIAPTISDDDEFEVAFACRRHDGLYDSAKLNYFAREINERLGFRPEMTIHSPDNGYLLLLTNGLYEDELGESPVSEDEIWAQRNAADNGFNRE
ncbi:MAG: hypothetical protein P1U89_15070 [Verrucomicrobiales bacterium]|nr:hypothetical protein [Verrucomicrobiales bacterium]